MIRARPLVLGLTLAAALAAVSTSRAAAASCGDEATALGRQYHLSLGPGDGDNPQPGASAEAPATTESRGPTQAPDTQGSGNGLLSDDATQPGPAAQERAKAEGLLAQARSADAQGDADLCRDRLRQAQALLTGQPAE